MASKTMRVLNIVSGVLLILIGIYCLCADSNFVTVPAVQ